MNLLLFRATAHPATVLRAAVLSPVLRSQLLAALLAAWFVAHPAAAQNPFDDGAPNPFGGQSGTDNGSADDRDLAAEMDEQRRMAEEKDPAVLALRDSQPSTSYEIARALQITMAIGRFDEASRYFIALDQANLTDAERAGLHAQFGTPFFLRIARQPAFAPRGRIFADAVLDAALKASIDPVRINQHVQALTSQDPRTRATALSQLKSLGTTAVNPLLAVLSDDARQNEHAAVQVALSRLGTSVHAPVVAAYATDNPALRTRLARVFELGNVRQAIPYLAANAYLPQLTETEQAATERALQKMLGAVPSQLEVASYLYRRAESYLSGGYVGDANALDEIEVWLWNAAQRGVQSRWIWSPDAATFHAARLAEALFAISSDNHAHRRLYIVATLMRDKSMGGLAWPLPPNLSPAFQAAAKFNTDVLEDALLYAVRNDHMGGAIGIVEVLGAIGTPDLVEGATSRPLALCLRHPDRRLRFAATDAILNIGPDRGYPGSSRLAESLGYLSSTVGLSAALVAHPRASRAQTIVGMLAQLGLEGDIATTGDDLIRKASQNPDCEYILISDAIESPALTRLLEQLRRNITTARTPIAIMSRSERFEAAQQLADRYDWTEAFAFNASISASAVYEVQVTSRGDDLTPVEDVIAQIRARDEFANMGLRITATGRNYVDSAFLARNDPLLEASNLVPDPSTFRDVNYAVTIFGDATPLAALLEYLRSTSPARGLEVAVESSVNQLDQIASLAEADPGIAVTDRLTDLARVSRMITRLTDRSRDVLVGREERLRHAHRCLDWLTRLTEIPERYSYYDYARQESAIQVALASPGLVEKAAAILGNVATPTAQSSLVTLASQNSRPLSERQAAAEAFASAVDRSGILLTTSQIANQYHRYNQSETLDKETQRVLGSILDTIEKPTATLTQQEVPAGSE